MVRQTLPARVVQPCGQRRQQLKSWRARCDWQALPGRKSLFQWWCPRCAAAALALDGMAVAVTQVSAVAAVNRLRRAPEVTPPSDLLNQAEFSPTHLVDATCPRRCGLRQAVVAVRRRLPPRVSQLVRERRRPPWVQTDLDRVRGLSIKAWVEAVEAVAAAEVAAE